jgi:hypothetical protein
MSTTEEQLQLLQSQMQQQASQLEQVINELNKQRDTNTILENRISAASSQSTNSILSKHSTSSSLKPPKPETFTGQHVDTFIFALEKAFQFYHTLPSEQVPTAVMYFRESALRWFKSIEGKYNGTEHLTDWYKFKVLMKKQFEANNTESVVRSKLNSLQQFTTVSKYNDMFNTLIIQILDMDERSKVDMYCRGLKSNVKLHVMLKEPTTLDSAQSAALNIDTIINYSVNSKSNKSSFSSNRNNNNSSGNHQQSFSSSTPMEIGYTELESDEVAAVQNGKFVRLSDSEHQRCMRERLCFRCKSKDHVSRNCPMKQLNQSTR